MEQGSSEFNRHRIFGIIGMGLMGGSYAKRLRQIGVQEIIGVDISAQVCVQAEKDGCVDRASTDPRILRRAEVVIFCLPAAAMVSFLRQYGAVFRAHALLTDITGIKEPLVPAVRQYVRADLDFILAHPMAGREGSGYAASRADIFDGANYIIVRREENTAAHLRDIGHLARALGCAHIVTVTPAVHDRYIAYTSNLPHILAVALVNSAGLHRRAAYFTAGSFRDASRVADINASLWTWLLLANKENVLHEISSFQASLQGLTQALRDGDEDALLTLLEKAGQRRREWLHERN